LPASVLGNGFLSLVDHVGDAACARTASPPRRASALEGLREIGETGRAGTASIVFARRLRAPRAACFAIHAESEDLSLLPAEPGPAHGRIHRRPSVVTLVTPATTLPQPTPEVLRRSRARPRGAGWGQCK
jgi:hypothetical protein